MITRPCIKIVTLCAIIAYLLYIVFEDYIKIVSYNIFVELVSFWFRLSVHKQLKTYINVEFLKRYEK